MLSQLNETTGALLALIKAFDNPIPVINRERRLSRLFESSETNLVADPQIGTLGMVETELELAEGIYTVPTQRNTIPMGSPLRGPCTPKFGYSNEPSLDSFDRNPAIAAF